MGRQKRRRIDPTDELGSKQLGFLCMCEEQREYERIRPHVLFGEPVPARAAETGISERVLYRRIAAFRKGGMQSLLGSPEAKPRAWHASARVAPGCKGDEGMGQDGRRP